MAQKFQTIGLISSLALIVGSIFGTGIFITPSYVARFTSSLPVVFLLWALGALLCLIGGNIYGRLGERYPQSGGPYVYLREAFGTPAALTYGWMSFLIISPTMIASYSMFFGEQLRLLFPSLTTFEVKGAALFFVFSMTLINAFGIRPASTFEKFIVSLQCALIVILSFALMGRGLEVQPVELSFPHELSFSLLASAMAGILWSFEGFTCLSFVAHEVHDAHRRLRRAIFGGVFVVFIIYVIVNFMALRFLSREALMNADNSGAALASLAFGSWASVFTAILMLVAVTMSCLPATLIGPRVTYEMAVEGYLPSIFKSLSRRGSAPVGGLLVQGVFAVFFILIGNFEWLISSFVTVTWIFYMIVGIAFLKVFSLPKTETWFRWQPLDFLQTFLFSGLASVVVALQFWRDFMFSVIGLALSLFLFFIMRHNLKTSRTLN